MWEILKQRKRAAKKLCTGAWEVKNLCASPWGVKNLCTGPWGVKKCCKRSIREDLHADLIGSLGKSHWVEKSYKNYFLGEITS